MSLDTNTHDERLPTGRRGHTAQNHTLDGPRKLLAKIQRQNPRFDDYEVFQEFWEQVQKPANRETLKAIVHRCVKNDLEQMRRLQRQEEITGGRERGVNALGLTKPQVAARLDRFRIEAKAEIARKLMDEIVINGKKLGDLTGKDLRKLGGNCARLSQKVPPTKKVREVLSHEEFNKLWKM